MTEEETSMAGRTRIDRDFENDVQRLGQYAGQLHEDLAAVAKGASAVAQSGMAAAKEGGKAALEAAKKSRARATASLRTSMADHPGATVGVAVGVGLLIGIVGAAIARGRE